MRPPPPDTWPPLVYDAAPPANRTSVRPSPVVLPPEAAERIVGPMNIALGHEAACAAAARHGNGGPGAAAIIGIVVGELALALAAALFVLWARRAPKTIRVRPERRQKRGRDAVRLPERLRCDGPVQHQHVAGALRGIRNSPFVVCAWLACVICSSHCRCSGRPGRS